MKNVLELIEQVRFAELDKIDSLSKAQEQYINARNINQQETSD